MSRRVYGVQVSEGRRRLANLKGRQALRKPRGRGRALSRMWATGLTGVVGAPGTGKTYFMTRYALSQLRRGRHVYANYRIHHKLAHMISVEDLTAERMKDLRLEPGALICISEGGIWYNSRMSMFEFSPEDFLIYMQGRKVGLEFWWDAQRIGSVDVYLRELSTTIWCMAAYPWPWAPSSTMMFLASAYRRHLLEEVWEPVGQRWVLPSRRVYRMYDTEETVDVPEKHIRRSRRRNREAIMS